MAEQEGVGLLGEQERVRVRRSGPEGAIATAARPVGVRGHDAEVVLGADPQAADGLGDLLGAVAGPDGLGRGALAVGLRGPVGEEELRRLARGVTVPFSVADCPPTLAAGLVRTKGGHRERRGGHRDRPARRKERGPRIRRGREASQPRTRHITCGAGAKHADILVASTRAPTDRRNHPHMAVATSRSTKDRRAEGHHRDGPPVRRRADPPEGRALRPRGRVPRADRRADEGARPVRRHHPRGVRRDGARPDDLRDDRRGALARLDLDLRRRQHPLHRLLPADEVRHRRAEGAAAAADGHRRDPRGLQPLRARARLRRAGDQDLAPSKSGDGDYEINGQKMWVTNGLLLRRRVRAGQDRPRRRPAATRA